MRQIKDVIVNFLTENKGILNKGQFKKLYEDALLTFRNDTSCIGEMTVFLYSCGIDPLKYMKEVPLRYLADATGITSVVVPEGVELLRGFCFSSVFIEDVQLPSTLTKIEPSAFSYSDITSLDLPDKVESVPTNIYYHCDNLTSVSVGSKFKFQRNQFSTVPYLSSVDFRGTKAEFRAINEESISLYGLDKVVCTDGTLEKGEI